MRKFSEFKKRNKIYEDDQFSAKSLLPETESEKEEKMEVDGEDKVEDKEKIEEPINKEVTKSDPAKFFSKLFESREMAHIYHLQTKSYAEHNALDTYYTDVLGLIDSIIETYSGQYEIVENYDVIDVSSVKSVDKIQYLNDLVNFIKDTRYMAILKEDTHLQNIVDEVVALIYRTLYKLKNLK